MNKTILILLSIFVLGSCTRVNIDNPGNKEEIENFKQQVQRAQDREGRKYDDLIKEFEYKGHQYIWFEQSLRQGYAGFGYAGVVHNPDCKCFKKVEE